MNTIRFTSKDAFVAALENRRPFWRAYDERQAREHKADERQWLKDARARMREALKWDYDALHAEVKRTYGDGLSLGATPRCPKLMEPKIDGVLAALQHTQGKAFTVDTKGTWSEAHNLLTWDPDAPTSVC